MTGTSTTNLNIGLGARAERIMSEFVTGNYFQQLGVAAQIGRTLLPSDEIAPGQHPVVVLSDAIWRRRFNGDAGILGQPIRLNGYELTVVGVAATGFHGTIVSFDVDAFIPMMMSPQVKGDGSAEANAQLLDRQNDLLAVMGRLRPGTTLTEASAQMAVLSAQLQSEHPADAVRQELRVVPIWQSPFGAQTYMLPTVTVLSGMGVLLLLIVCANLAALVLARGVSRRGEIALRLALGARRTRILRLLLVESLVLAIPGAVGGLALVPAVMPMALSALSTAAPIRLFFNLSIDWRVVAFAGLAAFASALVFGLIPAVRSSRADLLLLIKENLSPRGAARARFRDGLVIAQVAVSLLLLIGAGLVARSVDAARRADTGFDARDVISLRVDVRPNGYDEARGRVFFMQLLEAMRTDAGMEAVTLATATPLTLVDDGERKVVIDGYTPGADEDLTFLSNEIGPDYFRTLRIALLSGREFESRDDAGAPGVAIVNETLARRFLGGSTSALGRRLHVAPGEWRTVVGVVRDIKYSRINEAPRPYVYLPFLQSYKSMALLHARGQVPIATLLARAREHVLTLDPDLQILTTGTLHDQTQASLGFLQMGADMLLILGVVGMALAAMGIYGLVAYTVKQSTHEIGIRMALGARQAQVVGRFLGRGLRLGAIGTVIGTCAALVITRLLSRVLYGVSASDGISFVGAVAVMLATVSLATVIPAWRAARTSPLAALRQQ